MFSIFGKKPNIENKMTTGYNSKKKASIIICANPQCNKRSVETEQSSLTQSFVRHLKTGHNITPTKDFISSLENKINYIRNSPIPYTDPFLHVPWDSITIEGKRK